MNRSALTTISTRGLTWLSIGNLMKKIFTVLTIGLLSAVAGNTTLSQTFLEPITGSLTVTWTYHVNAVDPTVTAAVTLPDCAEPTTTTTTTMATTTTVAVAPATAARPMTATPTYTG